VAAGQQTIEQASVGIVAAEHVENVAAGLAAIVAAGLVGIVAGSGPIG